MFLKRVLITCLLTNLFQVNTLVFAQSTKGEIISLPAPQLKTNNGQVYTETCWDLDLMKYNYTRPCDNPVPPGDSFNPIFQGSVADIAPVIGEYTLEAKEDRSINTMGRNFSINGNNSKDTKVWIYRQTTANNARLYNPALVRERDDYLICTIDSGEPYGMYLMWIENDYGAGYPVRINAPVATWIGPEHVVSGDSINIYGRNLSLKNDTCESYVYIRKWGAGPGELSRPATVIRVNPYKVNFIAPSGLTENSDYEVWLHNGHGGEYGWTGPLKLHIDPSNPYVWNGATIDVTKFGATGNGSSDDSKAIQNAINSADEGDRIYFPSGIYRLIANSISCDKSLSFEGAGTGETTIITDAGFIQSQMLTITNFPSRILNLKFKTLKSDGTGLKYLVRANGSGMNGLARGFLVQECSFETAAFGGNAMTTGLYGIICINTENINDINISNNNFTTQAAICVYTGENVLIRNNKIFGNWKVTHGNGNLMFFFPGGARKMDINNNFFQSVNHEGTVNDGDSIMVRAIVFQNWHGGSHNRIYIGENYIDRCGNPWDNSGEIILLELPSSKTVYNPTSVAINTMTLPGSWSGNTLTGQTVAIIKNSGIGQFRRIVANYNNQITLDRPWDVQPDKTSVVSLNTSADNLVIYNNTVIGVPNYFEQENATSGIQFYGSAFNNVIAKNTFRDVHHGIYIMGFSSHPTTDGSSTGSMGNLITGNSIYNAVYGLESIIVMYPYVMPSPLPNDIPWSGNVNNVFRDNQVSNMVQFTAHGVKHGGIGIIVGQLYNDWQNPIWNGPWVREILVEHNTVTDAAGNYLWFRQHQQFNTARKNTFLDYNKYPNTNGVYYSPQNKDANVVDNTYNLNIDTKYGGTLPGPCLQLSKRSLLFEVNVTKETPNQILIIKNAGKGSLNLSVSDDAAWLASSLNTSIINSENESSALTVKVDPAGLHPGTYKGTITIKGGTTAIEQGIGIKMVIDTIKPDTIPNCFIIDRLEILPKNPTSKDEIKVVCHSAFPSRSCGRTRYDLFIDTTGIYIEAYHEVGVLTYGCQSVDTINIGKLPGGHLYNLKYTLTALNLNCGSVQDYSTIFVRDTVPLQVKLEIIPEQPVEGEEVKIVIHGICYSNSVIDLVNQHITLYTNYNSCIRPTCEIDTTSLGFLSAGSYSLDYYLIDDCIPFPDDSIVYFENIVFEVKVKQNNEKIFLIFPNPAQDKINIQVNNQIKELNVEIFDLTGHVVRKEMFINTQIVQLDISDLAKGLYFLRLNYEGNICNKKIIIQ